MPFLPEKNFFNDTATTEIYTNKPRTTGEGYKGIVHQPDPEKKPDLLAGLIAMRKMHIRALEESGLPAADEMLYPENWSYMSP